MMTNDYISREALIEKLSAIPALNEHPNLQALCFEWAKAIPTADVQEVRPSRWNQFYKSGFGVTVGSVSECCDMWNERKTAFCPHCGAKMDGKDNPELMKGDRDESE